MHMRIAPRRRCSSACTRRVCIVAAVADKSPRRLCVSSLTTVPCDRGARERAERAEQKRQDEADKAWRRLLRAVFTRVRVAADYAEDDGGAGAHQLSSCWGRPAYLCCRA